MDVLARHNSDVIVIYLHGWSVCKKCRSNFLSIAHYYNAASASSMYATNLQVEWSRVYAPVTPFPLQITGQVNMCFLNFMDVIDTL